MPKLTESIKNLVYNVEEGAWIGWERNERGKLGPKMCNMKNSMDPKWYLLHLPQNSVIIEHISV